MAKEEIKRLVENSKKTIQQDHDNYVKIIKDDLQNFKKKTLGKI